MWITIISLVLSGTIAGLIYLCTRFLKFGFVRRLAGERKAVRRLLGLLPILLFVLFCFIDLVDSIIVVLHLMVFWIIADLGAFIVRRILRKSRRSASGEKDKKAETDAADKAKAAEGTETTGKETKKYRPYWLGIGVLLFTTVYLGIGWYLAHHIWRTVYDISTEKNLGQEQLKVVLFADSHIGSTFDGEGFEEHVNRMQEENPDLVLISGDYVDDRTKDEDMIRACQALGKLKTTYGVYYVHGNHDKGRIGHRSFDYDKLVAELEKNGVVVLEDESELINNSFYIVGRRDKSEKDRKPISELIQDLDQDKYMIVLDHQPGDYDAEEEAGVDLVLSGHTHGGQLLPITRVGEWLGVNDRTYGIETRDKTTFVVTSGISDWSIGFKTGTKSEIVVLNIKGR